VLDFLSVSKPLIVNLAFFPPVSAGDPAPNFKTSSRNPAEVMISFPDVLKSPVSFLVRVILSEKESYKAVTPSSD